MATANVFGARVTVFCSLKGFDWGYLGDWRREQRAGHHQKRPLTINNERTTDPFQNQDDTDRWSVTGRKKGSGGGGNREEEKCKKEKRFRFFSIARIFIFWCLPVLLLLLLFAQNAETLFACWILNARSLVRIQTFLKGRLDHLLTQSQTTDRAMYIISLVFSAYLHYMAICICTFVSPRVRDYLFHISFRNGCVCLY